MAPVAVSPDTDVSEKSTVPVWPQPAAGIGKRAHIHRGETGHGAHAQQRAPAGQRTGEHSGLGFGVFVVRLVVVIIGLHAHRPFRP